MTHDCPCGCGTQVPRRRLACQSGWYRLPAELRSAINTAYHGDPRVHRRLLRKASVWYRDNPRTAA